MNNSNIGQVSLSLELFLLGMRRFSGVILFEEGSSISKVVGGETKKQFRIRGGGGGGGVFRIWGYVIKKEKLSSELEVFCVFSIRGRGVSGIRDSGVPPQDFFFIWKS